MTQNSLNTSLFIYNLVIHLFNESVNSFKKIKGKKSVIVKKVLNKQ